jgi:guanylate kinase
MSNKGKIFIVSGPSGAGKTTILNRFLRDDKKSAFSVSYTTRKKREGEKDGVDYHFIDRKGFNELIRENALLEWEEVHGELYGTPKDEIFKNMERGIDVFLDVDVNGALRIKSMVPHAVLIFIEPPSKEELIKRLKIRGEEEIVKRLERVEKELEAKKFFDYVIINGSLDEAYENFKRIVEEVRKLSGKDNS